MGTRKNRLAEAVLTSTHNLCFGAKIRKIRIPLQTPVLLYIYMSGGPSILHVYHFSVFLRFYFNYLIQGHLVPNFLENDIKCDDYMESVGMRMHDFNGFQLFCINLR